LGICHLVSPGGFRSCLQGARSQLSLLNIITELKKTCNHPFLFQSAEVRARLAGCLLLENCLCRAQAQVD
jgi:SNF2 family DNA or RNA helicase